MPSHRCCSTRKPRLSSRSSHSTRSAHRRPSRSNATSSGLPVRVPRAGWPGLSCASFLEALRSCFDIRSSIARGTDMPSSARRLVDAFLRGDAPSAAAQLAADATFHSPIRDYAGAEQIGAVWRAVAGVVAEAQPTSVHEQDGETIAFFAGTIKDQPVDGVLRALTGTDGRVQDITLMLRP